MNFAQPQKCTKSQIHNNNNNKKYIFGEIKVKMTKQILFVKLTRQTCSDHEIGT